MVLGVKMLVEKGVFEGVEVIFGMYNKLDFFVGIIGIKLGVLMVSVDCFEIDIKGVGGYVGIFEKIVDLIVVVG